MAMTAWENGSMSDHAASSVAPEHQTRPAWWVRSPPRVGVSSCLLGEPVRFNGGHKQDRFLTDVLGKHVEWVPVCPEVEVGMGTPRETLRLVDAGEGPQMVAPASGRDYTEDMTRFAERRIRELDDPGLAGYILKSKSPSCGLFRLPVYEGDQVSHRNGRGLFAAALAGAQPLLAIEEEAQLGDPDTRESFVERVFADARLRELFAGGWQRRDLVDFHARHKLQLMAHAPGRAKAAGRIVAAGDCPPDQVESAYTRAFLETLAVRATIGKHVNALHHALGQMGDSLDHNRRHDILSTITAYREGQVPLSVPTTMLQHHAQAEGPDFMRAQTYFDPFPAELGLRNYASA